VSLISWTVPCLVDTCLASLAFPGRQPVNLVQVVQTKTEEKEGYFSMQLGIGAKKDKQLHRRSPWPPLQHGQFTGCVPLVAEPVNNLSYTLQISIHLMRVQASWPLCSS
jgi:hypothetical protein